MPARGEPLWLLAAVTAELERRGVPHALIGAMAMAVHGIIRASDDLDLLITDRAMLRPGEWDAVRQLGATVDVRVGDDTDPLAGKIRLDAEGAIGVDVVVGRHAWAADIVRRAPVRRVLSVDLAVVQTADVILLKLYAGGAQDIADVKELLAAGDANALQLAVEREISRLPRDARETWRALAPAGGG